MLKSVVVDSIIVTWAHNGVPNTSCPFGNAGDLNTLGYNLVGWLSQTLY